MRFEEEKKKKRSKKEMVERKVEKQTFETKGQMFERKRGS